jgi:hypothetical protein
MIPATKADREAYAKLGGAIDNLSDAFPYGNKFVTLIDDARDPLANSGQLSGYLKVAAKAQKAFSYFKTIREALDEKKRDGGLLKLGVKVSLEIAGKVLGTSLTTHPYYAYHKAQIEALADALNASRNSREAVNQYKRAVAAANSTALASEFKRLESRKVDISASHITFREKRYGVAFDMARGLMSGEFAKRKIAEYGTGPLSEALADFDTWRATWAGLAFDSMQLQIMAGNEQNIAIEAINKVKNLMATLMGGSNTSRVGGYAAISNIEWEKYYEIVGEKQPDRLMRDPVKFAQDNFDKAAAWAQAFAEMCDFARGSDVIFHYNGQLEKLNKVLYG